jgi:hypothetical protein
MKSKLIVLFAAVAGFAGGVLSRYAMPPVVYAQAAQPEIRAQKFIVVGANGGVLGVFGAETNGRRRLRPKTERVMCICMRAAPMTRTEPRRDRRYCPEALPEAVSVAT